MRARPWGGARGLVLMLALFATCGSDPDDVDGQELPTDSATVNVVAALARVTNTPRAYRGVRQGDTLTFSAWGIDVDGDTIPVGGNWFCTDTNVLQLLNTTGDSVRAVAVGKGRARVSVDPASVVRLDIDSVRIGYLPTDQLFGLWSELSWDRVAVHERPGHLTRFCMYAYLGGKVIWMSDNAGCPDTSSNLGLNRELPLVPVSEVASQVNLPRPAPS